MVDKLKETQKKLWVNEQIWLAQKVIDAWKEISLKIAFLVEDSSNWVFKQKDEWYYFDKNKWKIVYNSDFWLKIELDVDLDSFVFLDWLEWIIAKDKNFAYYDWDKFVVDIETFEYLWDWFSRDRNNLYFCDKKVEWYYPYNLVSKNWKNFIEVNWTLKPLSRENLGL